MHYSNTCDIRVPRITLTHTSTLEIQYVFDFVYKTKRYDLKNPIYYVRNFSGTNDN